MIVLDTHAAVWLVRDDAALGKRSRSLADRALADDQLAISAISFWELALLISKGRLRSLVSASAQRANILATGIRELPLTGNIALLSVELDNLPGDPADRFIVATAIAHRAMLMTADDKLLRWRHDLVRQNAAK